MEPLDLTVRPPRSPYKKMEQLYMLPRTIDKLRAALPGGKVGAYWVRGSNPLLPSLSLVLLDGIGVTEECLLNVVLRRTHWRGRFSSSGQLHRVMSRGPHQ
jgi:Domain of unknown function (DUF5069)